MKSIRKRQTDIIILCNELREDSSAGHGIDPNFYEPEDLFDCIEHFVGFKLSERECRLAVVAFEVGERAARRSIWYEHN
jgi:hypothetical protein